jgi:hypothetical protein
MAVVKAVVLKHHKKEDGTFNVKVRVTHRREVAYIATPFFVVKSELNRKGEIKDNLVSAEISNYVNILRKALVELGAYVESYTAKSLTEYLKACSTRGIKNKSVDFVPFMAEYIEEMKIDGRNAYKNYAIAMRRLKEYAGERVPFENITPVFLERFEKYLTGSGTGQRGVSLYMSCYRKIFNEARKRLNDDDRGIVVVKNYPFSRYKVPAIPESRERAAGMDIVKHLYAYSPKGIEEQLAYV